MRLCIAILCSLLSFSLTTSGQDDVAPQVQFSQFIKRQATELRLGDAAPKSMDSWEHRRAELKAALTAAWGGFPDTACNLEPKNMGQLQRDGYRIEKLIFQTRPGIWMTANAYVPDKQGRLPAILNVHGHWAGAKQDPVVQSRCIGAAKLGFFVLSVDAFGAGERGIGKNLGEYHGEMVGATLFPIGLPLSGLQVYENMRAVDYLQSRPEVDPNRIGITGASGGGNQSMYAGAMDERIRCVVPTCSVGNYQAYLGAACCMCEVVPGALRFTEEGDVLGLAVHRGLMITNATRDAFQFSVGESRTSFARAEAIASLYKDASIKRTIVESEHNYNQPMREAMYGWMTKFLKGEGDGSPVPEPEIQTEEPESLRCFPGDSRPDDFVTLPKFAAAEARRLLERRALPANVDEWNPVRQQGLTSLEQVLGGMPKPTPLKLKAKLSNRGDSNVEELSFESEPGLELEISRPIAARPSRLALLLDCDSARDSELHKELAGKLRDAGWQIVESELRATGRVAVHNDKIGRAPDHNSAEWSLWIGRPLIGQWTWDVKRTLDAITERDGNLPKEVAVIGIRNAGLVALCSAAMDERISHAVTINSLVSYVTDQPYTGQRLALMAPAILRDVGDVTHIASMIAPRKVTIAGGVQADGKILGTAAISEQFRFTEQIFKLIDSSSAANFQVVAPEAVAETLR